MLLTLEVLKLFKFKEVRDLQSLNICSIFLTCSTLKEDKSNDLRLIQFRNKDLILIAFVVTKLDKSIYSKLVQ